MSDELDDILKGAARENLQAAGISERSQTPLASKNLTQLSELVDEHARDWLKVGQSGSGYVYDPSTPYDKKAALETTASLKQEIERLTRERNSAREALQVSEARVREHWSERDRLRAALEIAGKSDNPRSIIARALAGEHFGASDETAGEPVPTAWMRGIRSYIPGEPDEWNADFSYGDDRPDGDGWVPLYRMPVRASSGGVSSPDQTRASTDLGSQQEPSPVAANSPSKASGDPS